VTTSTTRPDPDTGRLRLTTAEFTALTEADGPPDEALRPAVEAVRSPSSRLQLDVSNPGAVAVHRAWLTPTTVALLLAVRDDLHDLLTVPPDAVPGLVARTVRLGPRKVPSSRGRRAVPPGQADDLVHPDPHRRLAAFEAAGATERHFAWRLQTVWPDTSTATGLTGRGLAVLDGPDGLFSVEEDDTGGRGEVLVPTTASVLWRVLTSLLPVVEEPR
jgi:hypothetical protein